MEIMILLLYDENEEEPNHAYDEEPTTMWNGKMYNVRNVIIHQSAEKCCSKWMEKDL